MDDEVVNVSERILLARMFFEDIFTGEDAITNLEVRFVPDDIWARSKMANEWNDAGINPASFMSGRLTIWVNLQDFVAASRQVDDDDFPRYLLYWKIRLEFRLLAEAELGPNAQDKSIDELASKKAVDVLEKWWV